MSESLDVEKLRRDYPVLERRFDGKKPVYLDSACTALKPRQVARAIEKYYIESAGCGGNRSTHLLAQEVQTAFDRTRRETAAFIGAESEKEVVFTSGTTDGANLLATAFDFSERKEVVATTLEHNAVALPFIEAAQRERVALKWCPCPDGRIDLDALETLITDKTALVLATRASNVFGGAQPLAQICRMAHRKGARVFSDAAQYVATHDENVQAADVDFLAFSAHKLGGPFGIGVFYGKERLLNALGRYRIGGGTVQTLDWSGGRPQAKYLDAPHKLEAGVPNYGGAAGLSEIIALRRSLPIAAVRRHVAGLVRAAHQRLRALCDVRILGRAQDLEDGALLSFYCARPDFSAADFNLFLNHELKSRVIAVRVGEHCAHLAHSSMNLPPTIRVSFLWYNTLEEVELFCSALEAYMREACVG